MLAAARASSRRAAACAPAVAARLGARSHSTGQVHASASRSVPAAWLSAPHRQAGASGADQLPSAPLSLLSVHGEGLPFIFVPSLGAAPLCAPSSVGGAPGGLAMEAAMLLGVQGEGGFGGAMAFDWGESLGEAAAVEELQAGSVVKKRKTKMNKHKWKKRKARDRSYSR